ncbi:hypothetical protein CSKR_203748 [Clonorchis sinensis]|uniref:Uncharacterized protein n=1 Tax=Clonorchis sinensis TaxID=79923 RepID=A0A8T1N0U7_CLOSI|nr:hypothetical protein CSKR_203748 [Clonorchis sinensis]
MLSHSIFRHNVFHILPLRLYGIPCSAPIHWDAAGIVVTTETYMRLSRYADDQFSYSPMSLDHGDPHQKLQCEFLLYMVFDSISQNIDPPFLIHPHRGDLPSFNARFATCLTHFAISLRMFGYQLSKHPRSHFPPGYSLLVLTRGVM